MPAQLVRETIAQWALPYHGEVRLERLAVGAHGGPRVAVVAGIHGDELAGMYLCQRLAAWLEGLLDRDPSAVPGRIEVYPTANSLAIGALSREVPALQVDLNRCFPGDASGPMSHRLAGALLGAVAGAALVVDVHASNRFLRELPQVRVQKDLANTHLALARAMNLDLVWLQGTTPGNTLRQALGECHVPCLSVEMGIALRLEAGFVRQAMLGILCAMRQLGVLKVDLPDPPVRSIVADDANIHYLNAPAGGLFEPRVEHGAWVAPGEVIGHVLSPYQGRPLADVRAPCAGRLFTLRELPLVETGSLLARVVDKDAQRPLP